MWRSACRRVPRARATAPRRRHLCPEPRHPGEPDHPGPTCPSRRATSARSGVDLDRDGSLGTATRVAFAFDPRNGVTMSWVGRARTELDAGRAAPGGAAVPRGHRVRAFGALSRRRGRTARYGAAARLKELRYARKTGWRSYTTLMQEAQQEAEGGRRQSGRARALLRRHRERHRQRQGLALQGFIEAADGSLRPQTYEESLTCVGCHGAIGRGVDSIISFPRKVADGRPAAAGTIGAPSVRSATLGRR